MLPVATRDRSRLRGEEAGDDEGPVDGSGWIREADDCDDAARSNKFRHASEAFNGIHVVEHRAGGHEVEGAGLERIREDVAVKKSRSVGPVRV
jgi:hypothetical protein